MLASCGRAESWESSTRAAGTSSYDERWRWQAELFREYGADVRMVETDAAEVQHLVEGSGFERVRHEEAPYQLVFRTEEEWWFWSWSHGTRVLFEAVPTARLEALREELARGLRDQCTGADGLIRGSMSAFVITAEKPTANESRRGSLPVHGKGARIAQSLVMV